MIAGHKDNVNVVNNAVNPGSKCSLNFFSFKIPTINKFPGSSFATNHCMVTYFKQFMLSNDIVWSDQYCENA